jgi:hypothetical protein
MRYILLLSAALLFSCSKEDQYPEPLHCEWAGATWCQKILDTYVNCVTFGKDGSYNGQYRPVIWYESDNCIDVFIYNAGTITKRHKIRNVTNKYMEMNDWYQTPYRAYYKQ